jgi:hypothetical protein
METTAIIHEIDSLPTCKRMFIVEHVIRSIRLNNKELSLETAADRLYADYNDDKELTAFTRLDCEDFYEPR